MKLVVTGPFERDFRSLPNDIQKRVEKTLRLLVVNPRHPSLRIHKMEPKEREIFEARVTQGYRLTFTVLSGALIVRRVGTHDILRTP